MARPTKRTPDVEKRIMQALAAGVSRKAASEYAGIDQDTFGNWMRRYADFSDAVIRAESSVEVRAALAIRQAFDAGDWRAAVEWLKRRRSSEWGDTQRIEIINSVRELARAAGADEEAAVAEAQAFLKDLRGARARS